MAFHFKNNAVAIPYIYHSGVFSGTLYYLFSCCGEFSKVHLGTFVGAVFRPHGSEDSDLG